MRAFALGARVAAFLPAELAFRPLKTFFEPKAKPPFLFLWPLEHKHINFLGKYSFALADPVARGELRPLRDPAESLALA